MKKDGKLEQRTLLPSVAGDARQSDVANELPHRREPVPTTQQAQHIDRGSRDPLLGHGGCRRIRRPWRAGLLCAPSTVCQASAPGVCN
jgi:hypothetical protein